MLTVKSKAPDDIAYIEAFVQRIASVTGSGQNGNLLNDITFMIKTKGIKNGSFGYNNISYTDAPPGASNWGYVEYFKHATSYVTVRFYPENTRAFYVGRFVLGDAAWLGTWAMVQYAT